MSKFEFTKGGPGSGRHAQAVARLRAIAAEAKANDWDSPRTGKRPKTDVLGNRYKPEYGDTIIGQVRRQNARIGRTATSMADRIEAAYSKPLSQHIAEMREDVSKMRNDAYFHSMVDNYDTARLFRDSADVTNSLIDLIEREMPTAPPATVEPPVADLSGYFGYAHKSALRKGGPGSGRTPHGYDNYKNAKTLLDSKLGKPHNMRDEDEVYAYHRDVAAAHVGVKKALMAMRDKVSPEVLPSLEKAIKEHGSANLRHGGLAASLRDVSTLHPSWVQRSAKAADLRGVPARADKDFEEAVRRDGQA